MRITLLFFIGILTPQVGQVATADPNKSSIPVLKIVFFTPSDIDPPPGADERMKQIANYTQSFLAKWMKHWGYESTTPLSIRRDKKGNPEILYIKGRHTYASGRYRKLGFQQEVIRAASEKYKIPPKGQVWWIFLYKCVERGWGRGGGNFQRGGVSTAGYYIIPGDIKTSDKLADGLLRQIMLKGCIHELGHALGLPHVGPKDSDGLGNTLMGPVNNAYSARKDPKERRVYLSKASASMVWKHPLFTGSTKDRDRIPKFQFVDFQDNYNKDKNQLIIQGRIKTDYPAHSVIVASETKTMRTDYWVKTYVGQVEDDGTFKVVVDELEPIDGRLKIVFCFNNGAVVGENSKLGLRNGFSKNYRFTNENIVFTQEP